jgi:hypothetical protein
MACRSFVGESFFCRSILRNVLCFVLLCIQQKFSKEVLYGANGKPLYAFYGVNDGPGKLCVHSSIRSRMRAECMYVCTCVLSCGATRTHTTLTHNSLALPSLPPSLYLPHTQSMLISKPTAKHCPPLACNKY